MALDGNKDHDDQARSKATHETAFQSDAFEGVPKRVPNHETMNQQINKPMDESLNH
jgi:hypothetical protein